MTISSIYLSSTYDDLKSYRETVAKSLRRLNKTVIGMEDYVAGDTRPLDKCLADVARADVYVGIFAHRYGYIPERDNPESRSITELEYRHAVKSGKRILIFLLSEDTPWLLKYTDASTGDGGKRINALRDELAKEKLASLFASELELANLVTTAVANLEGAHSTTSRMLRSRNVPEKRQIFYHLFLTFVSSDKAPAHNLANELTPDPQGLRSLPAEGDLLAVKEEALLKLDNHLQTCDVAVTMLSRQALAQMEGQRRSVELVFEIMRSRTGSLVALCRDTESLNAAPAWGFTECIDVSGFPHAGIELIDHLKKRLEAHCTDAKAALSGVPLVIAAMTKDEASNLCNNPNLILDEMGGKALKKFEQIRAALPQPLSARYGDTREQWRSPGLQSTMTQVSQDALQRLASLRNSKLRGRAVKLQHYPLDPLVQELDQLREVYRQMADQGCIMLIDELSLFHPDVRRAVTNSPMVIASNTAILTVSPFDSVAQAHEQILRDELKVELRGIFDRFATDYDPQCELGVSDDCRLRRWLHQSLPETLETLRTPRVEQAQVTMFAKELQSEETVRELPGIV